MPQQNNKKQTFLQGAIILIVANMMVKVIGALFKIPLQHLLLDEGMGVFNVAYQFYTAMFVISTAGVPVALSKMISESYTLGRNREIRSVVRIAGLVFITLGALCSAFLFFGASWLGDLIKNPAAVLSMKAVAPSVFFVACISVVRGYYQGKSNMLPTAMSQLVEALGKLFLGLGFAAVGMFRSMPVEVCTALAILGITIGEAVAAVGIWVYYMRDPARHARSTSRECRSTGQLVHGLLWLVIPITLTNSVTSLTTLVDTTMVVSRLQSIGYSLSESNELFGMYNTKAFTMYNLPQTLIAALAISIVPAIASAMAKHDKELTSKNLGSAMRISMLIALPAATGYFVLSEPIIRMLFKGEPEVGAACLRVLCFAIPFVALVSLTNAVLQAAGRVRVPVISMLLGGVIKVVVNYTLVGMPQINIYGAPFGTVVCYTFITIVNLVILRKYVRLPGIGKLFVRPMAACLGMGAGAYITYRAVYSLVSGIMAGGKEEVVQMMSNMIGVVLAICVAAVIYVVLLLALHALERDDIMMMPKGDKLVKLLRLK